MDVIWWWCRAEPWSNVSGPTLSLHAVHYDECMTRFYTLLLIALRPFACWWLLERCGLVHAWSCIGWDTERTWCIDCYCNVLWCKTNNDNARYAVLNGTWNVLHHIALSSSRYIYYPQLDKSKIYYNWGHSLPLTNYVLQQNNTRIYNS